MKKVKITFLLALLAALLSCKKAEKNEIEKPTVKNVSIFVGSGGTRHIDGIGINTAFYQPAQLTIDAADNIYAADEKNNCIRKITPSGVVTTVAGNGTDEGYADGTGTAARFKNPCGVVADANGNLYVADSGNSCIRKISPTGVVTTLAGSGTMGSGFMDGIGADARFNNPIALCIDGSGNIIVCDLYNNRLRKVTPAGVVSTFAGNGRDYFQDGPISEATMPSPAGLTVDANGDIYVANIDCIRKITPQGIVSLVAGSEAFYSAGYVNGPRLGAKFRTIFGLAIDKKGNLYVADRDNHVVRKITPEGYTTTYAGLFYNTAEAKYNDGPAELAYFARPVSLVINKEGNLLVSERDGHRIRKITEIPVPDSPEEFARKNWNRPAGWK